MATGPDFPFNNDGDTAQDQGVPELYGSGRDGKRLLQTHRGPKGRDGIPLTHPAKSWYDS